MRSLILRDFQPYEFLPDVMGAADVLVAVLETDASQYSVPSKVLSYLCAGRPVLGLMPPENGASTTIRRSGAGVVVPPQITEDARHALDGLLTDHAKRHAMGSAARMYAETHFDIAAVALRFQGVLADAVRLDRRRRLPLNADRRDTRLVNGVRQ